MTGQPGPGHTAVMRTLGWIAVSALALPISSPLACGGKIVEEPGAGPTDSVAADPPPPKRQESTPPRPPSPLLEEARVADACGAICDRKGRCGAWQSDCDAECESEI